ncbi:hypothetical protein MKZ38_000767 [Zalerion maritima]|uniref:DNA2/NAM7 helicase-like C-terminal domain-containing protein n=1 Tax=Zalerion maritima TaxID=339359 RepID=A0AAD5RFH6_9PEZI|nr:hypothetical protein MKZ38_000767 [Zalerion maritima]
MAQPWREDRCGSPSRCLKARHDNDYIDISQIRIFPTAEEIASQCPEFLPSIDFSSPHFLVDPLKRYIDSNYRLLRHDIFGPVKELLRRTVPSLDQKLPSSARNVYCAGVEGLLVNLPEIISATFKPVLERLQRISQTGGLRFQHWILPILAGQTRMPPPAYARRTGFQFYLESIAKPILANLVISPMVSANDMGVTSKLESCTELDPGQYQGLVAALTREFTLIQGPPGTGESYLGVQLVRILLRSKSEAHLGPIIIICFTNHALDQFLERLIEVGVHNVVRIGSQSQSQTLCDKILEGSRNSTPKTRLENATIAKAYSQLDLTVRSIEGSLSEMRKVRNGETWGKQFQAALAGKLVGKLDQAESLRQTLDEVHQGVDCRALLTADVIGITATGLAKATKMLQRMHDNGYWLNHPYLEDDQDDGNGRSCSNEWEVQMAKALVGHIIRQGAYDSADIAVLTPYTRQLRKMRAAMRTEFEVLLSVRDEVELVRDGLETKVDGSRSRRPRGLRLLTVDNFQGEEAKIVVILLVRSNLQKTVGFLFTINRINVLLSRA